jgi:hypothetical protein
MKKNIFYKIAQELSPDKMVSEDTYNRFLGFLIANKNDILNRVMLVQRNSDNFNVDIGDIYDSNSPESIVYFYNNLNAAINKFNTSNYSNNPALENAFETLKRGFSQMYAPLERVNEYLKQEKKKEDFYQNSNYKESPKVLEDIEDQLNQNQSDEAPIQRRPPTVSKLDQLIYKVNQEAEKLSNQIKNQFAGNLFENNTKSKTNDDSERDKKLAYFNNIGNNFKKAASELVAYYQTIKGLVGKKTFPAKQSINALVGYGIISSEELSNKLPNIKSGLDLLYSIN